MEEKKFKGIVAVWTVIVIILQAILLIYRLGINPNAYELTTKFATIALSIFILGLILAFMILTLGKKKVGPIIGIITGILLVLQFTVINAIMGVFFIGSCVWMMVMLNKKEDKKEAQKEEPKEEQNEEKIENE